jgi:hypothetical protein
MKEEIIKVNFSLLLTDNMLWQGSSSQNLKIMSYSSVFQIRNELKEKVTKD